VPNPASGPASPPTSPPTPVLFQLVLPSTLPPGTIYGGSPEVMYALVRDGLGSNLTDLLSIEPDAFFDAVVEGIDYLASATNQRKVLVIIGDGGDNESERTFDEVLRRAQGSNVLMYAVALVDPVDSEASPKRLDQLARATGGVVFTPGTRGTVQDVLQRIAVDIHHTYTLGYEPDRAADGSLRKVDVRVSAPGGVRPIVRTRSGYLAAAVSSTTTPHAPAH